MNIKKALALTAILSVTLLAGCGSSSSSNPATAGSKVKSATPTTGSEFIDSAISFLGQKVSASNEDEIFHEDIAGSIGNHIVYSYNLFENRWLEDGEKEEMIEYLNKVDAKLKEDVYITGYTKMSINESMRFFGYQFIDGAVVREVTYVTAYDDPNPNLEQDRGTPVRSVDTTGLLDPKSLFPKVKSLAESHSSELCAYRSNGVYGDYILRYDPDKDVLLYTFSVNDYSEIEIDAKTGDTVSEYYFNGEIPD